MFRITLCTLIYGSCGRSSIVDDAGHKKPNPNQQRLVQNPSVSAVGEADMESFRRLWANQVNKRRLSGVSGF